MTEGGLIMNEQHQWYLYHNNNQLGPFGPSHIIQLLDHNIIGLDCWLFKAGWTEWKPLKDHKQELIEDAKKTVSTPSAPVPAAPRTAIQGRVIFHNHDVLSIGQGVNISSSGIFVEATENPYSEGEKLQLTCQVEGFQQSFHANAYVVRYNEDPRFPKGYGLQFDGIDDQILRQIDLLVEEEKRKQENQETQIAAIQI